MKKIFIICLLMISKIISAQTVIINNQQHENSAETETKYKNADYFSSNTQTALDNKDFDKAHYYLDQWSHHGGIDSRFYIQMADWLQATGNTKSAKKHLMTAYKKYGCYECKERADKL